MQDFLSYSRFLFLWILAGIFAFYMSLFAAFLISLTGGFLATFVLRHQEPSFLLSLIVGGIIASLIGLAYGWITGSLQKSLLRQMTDEHWNGWIIASMLGGLIGVVSLALLVSRQVQFLIATRTLPPMEMLWILLLQVLLVPMTCLALAQLFVLMGYVKGAWTWVMAHLVGNIAFFALLTGLSTLGSLVLGILLLFALTAIPALVTGFTFIWLYHFNWKYPKH